MGVVVLTGCGVDFGLGPPEHGVTAELAQPQEGRQDLAGSVGLGSLLANG